MSMPWFGTAWPAPDYPAPVCEDDRMRVDVPVGQRCLYCREPIEDDASGVIMPVGRYKDGRMLATIEPAHAECNTRSMFGGIAHLERRCICFGGSGEHDTGMTYREEARVVFEHLREAALAQRGAR